MFESFLKRRFGKNHAKSAEIVHKSPIGIFSVLTTTDFIHSWSFFAKRERCVFFSNNGNVKILNKNYNVQIQFQDAHEFFEMQYLGGGVIKSLTIRTKVTGYAYDIM